MDIKIFVEYKGQTVQIPVNPENLEVTRKGNNETTEIIQLGEINLLRNSHLRDISWESWFPYESWFPAIGTKGNFRSADFYKEFFDGIVNDAAPCRLVVTGINLSVKVSIEEFDYEHRGGEHEDAYYSVSFKEYTDWTITRTATFVSAVREDTAATLTTSPLGNASSSATSTVVPTEITIGSNVKLNGRVHGDSNGSNPGKSYQGYDCYVNLINKQGTHPYHITTPTGSWLGWVDKNSVELGWG